MVDACEQKASKLPVSTTYNASHGKTFNLTLDDMHPMMQQVFDTLIQKFQLLAFVRKNHKGQKKLYFDDDIVTLLNGLLVHQGIKLEDVVFMSSPPTL